MEAGKGKLNNVYPFLRILLGGFFTVSGFEKLVAPYQNFLYVIQSYDLLRVPLLEEAVTRVLPWCEFFIGIFLVLGFGLKWASRAVSILLLVFLVTVGQALIRRLPVAECGCFGDMISFPLPVVLMMDTLFLLLVRWMSHRIENTSVFGLDRYLQRHEKQ